MVQEYKVSIIIIKNAKQLTLMRPKMQQLERKDVGNQHSSDQKLTFQTGIPSKNIK